jgi:hypothetical protein
MQKKQLFDKIDCVAVAINGMGGIARACHTLNISRDKTGSGRDAGTTRFSLPNEPR